MSGLNHNMNHIVKRIETRVLAPPGGFSSFSLGHNFVDVRSRTHGAPQRAQAQAPSSYAPKYSAAKENYEPEPEENCRIPGLEHHYGGPRGPATGPLKSQYAAVKAASSAAYHQAPSASRRQMDDDADYDDVPQTYSARSMLPLQQQQQHAVALPSARRALTQAEYAAELRSQIMEKRNRDHNETMERGGNERRSMTKHQLLEEKMRIYRQHGGHGPMGSAMEMGASGGRFRHSASGSKSTWTISGN